MSATMNLEQAGAFVAGWLDGVRTDFRRGDADAPPPGRRFVTGDRVWLGLPCPVANPFTGARIVWAEALVLQTNEDGTVQVITESLRLQGPAHPHQLRPRLEGEIAPGRHTFGPGAARA